MPHRGQVSRARILEGASRILDSGVYGDLTVDALARVLHMSKSTLYKHFASKDDLVVSLVEEVCSETDRALEEKASQLDGRAEEALKELIGVYAGHAERLPRAAILQQARLPQACQDRVELVHNRMSRTCRDVIQRGVEQGRFRTADPALACTALMASARAVTEAAARGDVGEDRGEAVRRLLPLFEPGLASA